MCRVVNKYKESYDIYIGRGSVWGNPYKIGVDGTREEVISMYRLFLWRQIKSNKITQEQLLGLDGKVLGCFCKPSACHGDVIVNAVIWAIQQRKEKIGED